MTKPDITQLKKLNAERTRGEWRKRRWPSESVGAGRTGITSDHGTIAIMSFPDEGDDHTNAAFIVAVANALPSLLDRIERLEEALGPLVEAIEQEDRAAFQWNGQLESDENELCVRIGDLRRARNELKGSEDV